MIPEPISVKLSCCNSLFVVIDNFIKFAISAVCICPPLPTLQLEVPYTTASSSYLKPHTLLPTLAGTSSLSDLRQERDFYTQPLFPVEATQTRRKRPLKAAIDTLMVPKLS